MLSTFRSLLKKLGTVLSVIGTLTRKNEAVQFSREFLYAYVVGKSAYLPRSKNLMFLEMCNYGIINFYVPVFQDKFNVAPET